MECLSELRRQARQAMTLEEQHQIQETMQRPERQQRRRRQEIFKVEDEIMEKRDRLIGQLEKRLAQRTTHETFMPSAGGWHEGAARTGATATLADCSNI